MNYTETLDWMFAQLPMFQRQGKTAFKKDLTNSLAFSKQLDYPEKIFKSIHLAGTNGKGSTSHMIASVLQEAGYKVGLYTSPHLKDFRERIKVNGEQISEKDVVNFIENNSSFLTKQKLSFFEMTVGMAFDYFARQKVDIAIVEVGLGGRLDSTNIIIPEVSVITNIGLDHTQFLGETLAEIAFEKAGIIKREIPVVVGEYQKETIDVFKKIANKFNSQLIVASELKNNYQSDLKGYYQAHNVKTAVQTLAILKAKGFKVLENNIKNGLLKVVQNTGLLGRWQILNKQPKVICDTGHNTEGLGYVFKQIKEEPFENLHIVLGVVSDKNLDLIFSLFPSNACYYFCKPNIPRGLDAQILQSQAEAFGLLGNRYGSVNEAYNSALKTATNNDLIFIGGSTFVVAEVL